tara:strand:- start:41 stop:568 length:528 start_codon:yes stop_codon:yes gene_type:complete
MARRKRMYGRRRRKSPIENSRWNTALDRVQTGLSFAGLALPPADAINAAISSGRAVAAPEGSDERKKHIFAAGVNAAAIIPGVNEARLAVKGLGGLSKMGKFNKGIKSWAKPTKVTKQLDDAVEAVKKPNLIKTVGLGGNVEYWKGTGEQIVDEVRSIPKRNRFAQNKGFNFNKS